MLTFVHPGYSQAWTFFPFFALLIRWVVGVYVISPASNNPGIAIDEPRDDSPRPLVGIVLFCRCRVDSFGSPEAGALPGDMDDCFRRRVVSESVDFSSDADEGPEGERCSCFWVDGDVLIGRDW